MRLVRLKHLNRILTNGLGSAKLVALMLFGALHVGSERGRLSQHEIGKNSLP